MRSYNVHVIKYHAHRVQEWSFYCGAAFGLAFIGFAVFDMVKPAAVASILGAVAIGISVGAWIVGARFKD